MLWYKAWLDTRWRFLIGFALLMAVALGNVLAYPWAHAVLETSIGSGPLAGEVSMASQLAHTFSGYVWVQLVRQNLLDIWTIFAVLIGAEGLLSRRTGAIFTLSLPASRRRLCATRAAADLAELLLLALCPMLLVTLTAPAVGHHYFLGDALVYAIGLFAGGAVFYCAALLLSTLFADRWRPIGLLLAAGVLMELCRSLLPRTAAFTPAAVMEGTQYFRTGTLPWAAIAAWSCVSAAMLYAAVKSLETRDF